MPLSKMAYEIPLSLMPCDTSRVQTYLNDLVQDCGNSIPLRNWNYQSLVLSNWFKFYAWPCMCLLQFYISWSIDMCPNPVCTKSGTKPKLAVSTNALVLYDHITRQSLGISNIAL